MKNLESLKKIFLSEKINNDEKKNIVHSYFNYKSKLLSKDQEKQIEISTKKILEQEYLKRLGENWKDLTKKHKISGYQYYLLNEISQYSDLCWDELKKASLISPKDFPIIKDGNEFWNPLSKHPKIKKKLMSILFEILEIKYSVYQELLTRKLIFDIKTGVREYSRYLYLPRIYTFQDLRDKFPDVFDIYIQTLLENFDQVKIIEIKDEIEQLRNKLC